MQVHNIDDGRGQTIEAIARQRGQLYSVLASNCSHCHQADGIFRHKYSLSHALSKPVCRCGLVAKEHKKDRVRVSIILLLVQWHALGLGCCHTI